MFEQITALLVLASSFIGQSIFAMMLDCALFPGAEAEGMFHLFAAERSCSHGTYAGQCGCWWLGGNGMLKLGRAFLFLVLLWLNWPRPYLCISLDYSQRFPKVRG